MKADMYRKIVIIILALQAIANIVIFLFFINYITNPNSEFNRNIAQMVKQQAQSFKPLDGIKGDKGEQGVAGPVAQFRCNPNTFKVEYKYPADEDWTSMNAFCISSQ